MEGLLVLRQSLYHFIWYIRWSSRCFAPNFIWKRSKSSVLMLPMWRTILLPFRSTKNFITRDPTISKRNSFNSYISFEMIFFVFLLPLPNSMCPGSRLKENNRKPTKKKKKGFHNNNFLFYNFPLSLLSILKNSIHNTHTK